MHRFVSVKRRLGLLLRSVRPSEASGPQSIPIAALLAADWSKSSSRRAVYVATTASPSVRRLAWPGGWNLTSLLDAAEPWRQHGAVVVAIDAPLGVPRAYWTRARAAFRLPASATFLDLVDRLPASAFAVSSEPTAWDVRRPFFAVPKGAGGLTRVLTVAQSSLRRAVDEATGAKSPFIAAGIPGSVGSSAIALWRELQTLRASGRDVAVWPFDGPLATLTRRRRIVLAETYPRACYAMALQAGPLVPCAIRPLAKTQPHVRAEALRALTAARRTWRPSIRLAGLREAAASEDDFDACLTAVALLRATLHGSLLASAPLVDSQVEGGILGWIPQGLGLAGLRRCLRESVWSIRDSHGGAQTWRA